MSTPPAQRGPASAPDAVVQGLVDGWRRMVWLLFTGPHASVVNWAWWGVILLLAGVAGGGGGGGGDALELDSSDFGGGWSPPGNVDLDAGVYALIAAGVCCVLILAVVFIYIRSRFRFVMLDGVISGAPNIREPWSRTGEVGLQYFVWEILINLACLLLAVPLVLMWLPVIGAAMRGASVNDLIGVGMVVLTVFYVLLLVLVKCVVDWFVYDLALPLTWCRTGDFWKGLGEAVGVLRERLGAVFFLLIARFVVAIAGAIAGLIIICCTCWLWLLPVVPMVLLVIVSIPLPPLLVVTGPLILLLGVVTLWLIVTLQAPIYLFYRSWSVAFLQLLDPDFRGWEPFGPGAVPPPAAPPPSTTPPTGGEPGPSWLEQGPPPASPPAGEPPAPPAPQEGQGHEPPATGPSEPPPGEPPKDRWS